MMRRIIISLAFITALSCCATPSLAASSNSGFTEITGNAAQEYLADSLASGDFNGDGYDDILIGSLFYSDFK